MKSKFFEIDVNEIKPYKKNAKKHPEEQIKKIMASIEEFGIVNPIIIDKEKNIIAGHGRLEAIKRLGINRVPVLMAEHLTKTQIKAYRLADNKLAELGEWDNELLAIELKDLQDDDFDIGILGFEDEEINECIDDLIEGRGDEENIPDLSENVVTKQGDIIEMGEHKLLCGDSTDKRDVERLLKGDEVRVIFTSPPYNMGGEMYKDYDDNLKSEEYIKFNLRVIENFKEFLKGYLFWNISYNKNSRTEFIEILFNIIRKNNLRFLELIVWNKKTAMPITSKDMLTRQYELIGLYETEGIEDLEFLVLKTTKKKANLMKNRKTAYSNYWELRPANVQTETHKAAFPVELVEKGLRMTSKRKDIVADPFGRTGSTLVACEKMERVARIMEMSEEYCQLIIDRWTTYTGNDEIKINGETVNWGEYKQK